jgi:transcriptional regulator with XRE-family HTH domain
MVAFATGHTALRPDDEHAQQFGPFLKELRRRRSDNRAGFARQIGIDPSYFFRLEDGGRMPGRSVLEALELALRLSPVERDQFYALAGYLPPSLERLGVWPAWMTTLCESLARERVGEG